MKRKATAEHSEMSRPSGRRQPQISCDSCRRKKLKCDRRAPCRNCATRGLPCSGQPEPSPVHRESPETAGSAAPTPESDVLQRLLRLENAVFGSKLVDGDPTSELTPVENKRREAAKALDLGFTRSGQQAEPAGQALESQHRLLYDRPKFSILPASGAGDRLEKLSALSFSLMTKTEALCLLQDFTDSPVYLLPVIHQPRVRSVINLLYDGLATGNPPPDYLSHASLVFAIGATSAFFYHPESTIFGASTDPEQATRASMTWLKASLDLTDLCQRKGAVCLEHIQARVILSHLLYNVEGCSSRFRLICSSCVSLGRDMSLHLIDSPLQDGKDDVTIKETKRRLWWYIVSTDWLLGFMGGPLEGTYTVHPRHMNVRPVRNINGRDLDTHDSSFSHPEDVPTDVSFLIQRTHLADMCRQALDSRPIGAPEEDVTDCKQVLALNHAFEKSLAELPSFFHPQGPIPSGAPRCLRLQRDTILLAMYSRWARINRPFILKDNPDEIQGLLQSNCLKSARVAISIATDMLTDSRSGDIALGLSASASLSRRMSTTIGHLFGASAVLALNASRRTGAVDEDEDLKKACRVLTVVGEESPVAASLVRTLTTFLHRYQTPDVAGSPATHPPQSTVPAHSVPETPRILWNETLGPMDIGNSGPPTCTGDLGLDQLWNEFIDSAPNADSWDELFTGIDVCFGPT